MKWQFKTWSFIFFTKWTSTPLGTSQFVALQVYSCLFYFPQNSIIVPKLGLSYSLYFPQLPQGQHEIVVVILSHVASSQQNYAHLLHIVNPRYPFYVPQNPLSICFISLQFDASCHGVLWLYFPFLPLLFVWFWLNSLLVEFSYDPILLIPKKEELTLTRLKLWLSWEDLDAINSIAHRNWTTQLLRIFMSKMF